MNDLLQCPRCDGSGIEGHGHVMNDEAEFDGVADHICRVCPVPCEWCSGRGEIGYEESVERRAAAIARLSDE